MKIYTEEQVKKAFKSGFKLAMETDGGLKEGQDDFINSLIPIELPSDEEIQNLIGFACKTPNTAINGAKWMKEQIKNQII